MVGEKIGKFANRKPFAKIFLANITDTYIAIVNTVEYSNFAATYKYIATGKT